jgi:predicted MFS family arabinose efflux permease
VVNAGSITDQMSATERRATASLGLIYALRMLGLFMILPVFSLYAETLADMTPFLIGLAFGIYGLTQAFLQIPFGMLSDKIGRKPVIIGGLVLFALGSVVAANATDIWWVIIGRALQGSGAIAAAVMALAADLTREEQRTKMMATIGMSIGLSFMLAMVMGPLLDQLWGVPGIFMLTAVMAVMGILVVFFVVPNPVQSRVHRDAQAVPSQFKHVLLNSELTRLDTGIFCLHFILMANFVVIPVVLSKQIGFDVADHWQLYLSVLILSVVAMVPLIILAEKHHQMKPVFLGAILLIGLSEIAFYFFFDSLFLAAVILWLFFTAFNLLESVLPSLVSKIAPVDAKGTSMGVYSTSQFFGTFMGATCAGLVQQEINLLSIFVMNGLLAVVWFIIASGMNHPRYLSNFLLNVGVLDTKNAQHLLMQLTQVRGVAEVVIPEGEGVAYLKVDRKALDKEALFVFSRSEVDPA